MLNAEEREDVSNGEAARLQETERRSVGMMSHDASMLMFEGRRRLRTMLLLDSHGLWSTQLERVFQRLIS